MNQKLSPPMRLSVLLVLEPPGPFVLLQFQVKQIRQKQGYS